jgi:hypothetical protein
VNERDITIMACFSKQDTKLVRRIVASAALTRSLAAATADPPPPFTGGACTPWTGGSRGDEVGRKRKIPNSENLTAKSEFNEQSIKKEPTFIKTQGPRLTQTTNCTESNTAAVPVLRTNSFICVSKALSIQKMPFFQLYSLPRGDPRRQAQLTSH